jgi:hypothetical protein
VEDGGNGEVRLQFTSAETTSDGKTIAESGEPALPFALPAEAGHIRLIYLIRVSQLDHNMAIAVTKKKASTLDAFTDQFQRDPRVCKDKGEVSCRWVPMHVAVTPEKVPVPDR